MAFDCGRRARVERTRQMCERGSRPLFEGGSKTEKRRFAEEAQLLDPSSALAIIPVSPAEAGA
jgi:hypothetical protein